MNLIRKLKKTYHILQSEVAAIKLGHPAKKIKIIAVTGTSGKSTTATMIYHILKHAGLKVGLISTVEAVAGNKNIDTGFHVTTPDPIQLQKILREMKNKEMEYVVLETSSHSLDQGRLGFLKVDYAVYTNIKRDHLDWHKTWENYAGAKALLINKLKSDGKVILNKDDLDSYDFLRNYYYKDAKNPLNFIEYSKRFDAADTDEDYTGLEFTFEKQRFQLPVIGFYNIDNALAAIKTAQSLGLNLEIIADAFKDFKGVKGRMQIMQTEPFTVIIDFAHNADSLVQSLESVRNLKSVKRIISVFGSAGLRDVEKRFTMGEAAAKLSDVVVITSEDPRTESLYEINSEIIRGAKRSGAKLVKRFAVHKEYLDFIKEKEYIDTKDEVEIYSFDEENVNSRFDAIDFAIRIAKPGDVIITEGKGHEKSLCFGKTEYPFTDQEAVNKALKNL